ncbi:hypothetical protein C8R44DRAFT_762863 [Mycena epipterygia]|nr:hypothetical protein C8R44DRAFT_762863 [Mycena epipterygia]
MDLDLEMAWRPRNRTKSMYPSIQRRRLLMSRSNMPRATRLLRLVRSRFKLSTSQRRVYSHELGKLALQFDGNGRLRPNAGCWRPADFRNENLLVYFKELMIEETWRGKGLGTWLLPKLFHLNELNGANFMFTWPTVLTYLEPPSVNGMFGDPTPTEQADWLAKRDRIIRFYQKAGFRRLANSHFFCLAKRTMHPSHSITIDADAAFQELPPADTEEEERRRYFAYR